MCSIIYYALFNGKKILFFCVNIHLNLTPRCAINMQHKKRKSISSCILNSIHFLKYLDQKYIAKHKKKRRRKQPQKHLDKPNIFSMLTLQWTIVAWFLYAEIVFITFLVLPIISATKLRFNHFLYA